MNKWAKRKWVRALRSGEYKQVDGSLIDGTIQNASYCCLGVFLAECRPNSIVVSQSEWTSDVLCVPEVETQPAEDYIADDLAILWDLDLNTQKQLAELNDAGQSFAQIADWIEENL